MKLHKYQEDALAFSLQHSNCYLALDMGLGKTAIALYWAERKPRASLVIAPLRTIYSSWPEEIAKWTPNQTYTVLHGKDKNERLGDNVDLYLLNYDGLPWFYDALKRYYKVTGKIPFRSVVLDEGSMVKSSSTKRFKILKQLRDIFHHGRLILSGTPAPNSLLDLWSQYYFLDKGVRLSAFITHYRREHFYQVDRMGFIWNLRKGQDKIIYKKIEDITYRLDAADHLDLPERIDNIIKVKMPAKAMKVYKHLEDEFFLDIEGDSGTTTVLAPSAVALSMKLRQIVQGAVYTDQPGTITGPRQYEIFHKEKLKALEEIVEASAGQGILCAIQFKFELAMIKKKFPKAPVIAGGTSAQEAGSLIKKWNKGEIPLLLCHPASLSHGVNLQTGSHIIIWYGLTWSLEQYLQFNARLHRQGQRNTVVVHHLVMQDTIDMQVMKALKNKFKGQNELLQYLKEVRR